MSISSDERFALRARYVFPVSQPPCAGAAVTVTNGRIEQIGSIPKDVPVTDLGNVAIVPPLVNAHTHLEFSHLVKPLSGNGPAFADWLREVICWREQRDLTDPDGRCAAIQAGQCECLTHGTLGIGEIATGDADALDYLPTASQGVAYHELISLNSDRTSQLLQNTESKLQRAAAGDPTHAAWRTGLSPHAPYTASVELVESAVRLSRQYRVPLAMHLAETFDEIELLSSHCGRILELLVERDVWNPAAVPRGVTITDYLTRLADAHRSLVVHGNYLDEADWHFLASHSDRMTLVHCPRTHAFFGRAPLPLADILATGVAVALGTDSCASNPDLNLWEECKQVYRQHEHVRPAQILQMATVNGANALGLSGGTGTLAVGRPADLVAIALPENDPDDPYQLLFHESAAVCRVWLNGTDLALVD